MVEPVWIRKGWARVTFGDVVRLSKERSQDPEADGFERYVGLEHLGPGDLRVRSWGDVADGTTFTTVFQPGQVLFGKRRAYQRKVAVADFAGVCSGDIYVLVSKDPNVLLPELLPFICQTESFFDHAIGTSAGSLSPRTNWKSLSKYEFDLPPLEEQRRVAALLRHVDAAIDSLTVTIQRSDALLDALSLEEFGKGGIEMRELGEVVTYASDGPFGSKIKSEHYSERGVRVIRLQNIERNAWNDEDKAYVDTDYFQSHLRNYEVLPGDVVLAGLGDENIPAGRACVIPPGVGLAINKADCFCLRPVEGLDAEFLSLFLNSPIGLRQSAQMSQGTTRQRLNLANIKRMAVPVPERGRQSAVAQRLRDVVNSGRETQERAKQTAALRVRLIQETLRAPDVVQ